MKKIDDRAIELFDCATTAMQRRGLIPLNTLIMGTECLFWATGVAMNIHGWIYPVVVLAALSLWTGFERWHDARGYWENHRKAQQLNAMVLLSRDFRRLRLFVAIFVFSSTLMIWELLELINSAALICLAYLRCCRYLGPGDFARERRESLSGVTQEG